LYLLQQGVAGVNIVVVAPSICSLDDSSKYWMSTYRDEYTVQLSIHNKFYHDYLEDRVSTLNMSLGVRPDFIILFNAGLWGYESWIPTLRAISKMHQSIVLVTSYTFEEAEDDFDTIVSACEDGSCTLDWKWEPENNPHRSNIPLKRLTASEGRVYYDNGAWQCFQIINDSPT
jgi:hypothetical protein